MKFSGDYVDLVENIIILITVALWEICQLQNKLNSLRSMTVVSTLVT